jgi:hypothetical protein
MKKNESAVINAYQLKRIKIIHTAIWVFFNILLAYIFYAVLTNNITIWVWLALLCFVVEGIVLLIFKKFCPLTILARRYSDSQKDNFDIYLPNWLAKYNKLIYTSLLMIAVLILTYRLVTSR